jgi:hypothetical protein
VRRLPSAALAAFRGYGLMQESGTSGAPQSGCECDCALSGHIVRNLGCIRHELMYVLYLYDCAVYPGRQLARSVLVLP